MGQDSDVPLVGPLINSQWTAPTESTESSRVLWDLVAVREVLGEEHSIFLLEGIGVVREVVGTGLVGFLVNLWLFFSSMHIFHRRHRRFISFVPKSLFVSSIDYYYSRSTKLIWQQNVLCMLKAVREKFTAPLSLQRWTVLIFTTQLQNPSKINRECRMGIILNYSIIIQDVVGCPLFNCFKVNASQSNPS